MKSMLSFEDLTADEATKISAYAASLGTPAELKKGKTAKVQEPDPEEESDDEEEESPKNAKASKSGSKAGAKSSKTSKPKVVEEDDEDEDDDSDDEDEDEDDDDSQEKPKGYVKGKANLEGIKELAKALADKGKEATTKKILLEFGAKVVSKLDPADYIPVYVRLLKLNNKSK